MSKLLRHCGLRNLPIVSDRSEVVTPVASAEGGLFPFAGEPLTASSRLLRQGRTAAVLYSRETLASMSIAPLGLPAGGSAGTVITDANTVVGASYEPAAYWGKVGTIPRRPRILVVMVPADSAASGDIVAWGNFASLAAAFAGVWGPLESLGVHVYITQDFSGNNPLAGLVPIRDNAVANTISSLGNSNFWDNLVAHALGGVGGDVYWAYLGQQPLSFGLIGGLSNPGGVFGYIGIQRQSYTTGSPPPFETSTTGLSIIGTAESVSGISTFRVDTGLFTDKAAAHNAMLDAVADRLAKFQFTFWTPDAWTNPYSFDAVTPTPGPAAVATAIGRTRKSLPGGSVTVGGSTGGTNAAAAAAVAGAIVTDAVSFFTS